MYIVLGCVSPEQSGATGEDWGQAWARTPAPCPGAATPPPPLTLALMLYFSDLTDAVCRILFFYLFLNLIE